MVDLKSIVSLDKIEDNVEWIGLAAGALSDLGLSTPLVYAERFIRDGARVPPLENIVNWAFGSSNVGNAVKTGVLMAVGGAIGSHVLGGIGGRISRGAEKFGTGLALGGCIDAVLLASQNSLYVPASGGMNALSSGVYST